MKIYPSLISADLLNLKQVIATLDQHCDGYHLDVMDDHFVMNLTFGPDIINAIARATKKPLHAHLMVDNPEKWPGRLKLRVGDTVIVHYESLGDNYEKMCEEIRKKGWLVGLAINPETLREDVRTLRLRSGRTDLMEPVLSLTNLFAHVDMILCMTVHPGFAGQKLIPEVLAKVKDLYLLSSKISSKISIWVDGGVNLNNIRQIGESGATGVAVASAIFSQKDPIEALKKLYLVAGNTK